MFRLFFKHNLMFVLNVIIEGRVHDIVELKKVLGELVKLVQCRHVWTARIITCDDCPFTLDKLSCRPIDVNETKTDHANDDELMHFFQLYYQPSCLLYSYRKGGSK